MSVFAAVQLANTLVSALADKTLEPKPVAIVQQGMAILATASDLTGKEKKRLLVTAMKMIAAGPDGVPGTDDDVIPPIVTAGLGALIESEVLEDVIELAHDALTRTVWLPKCLRCKVTA